MTSKYSFTVTILAKTTTRYILEILIISKINSKYPGDGDLLRFTREIGYQRGGCFTVTTLAKTTTRYFLEILVISKINTEYQEIET